MLYDCTRCELGYYYAPIEKLPHTYGSWENNRTQHIRYRTACWCVRLL